MENSQRNKINKPIPEFQDIRQSDKWAEYLDFLGWKSVKTQSGINVEMRKSALSGIAKIQRPSKLSKKNLEEIDNVCKENGVGFLKLEPDIKQDMGLLKKAEYKPTLAYLTPPSTVYIDLQKDEDELWRNISKSGKYSVRRAQREGAKVETHKNPSKDLLSKFYKLEQATAKRKRFGLHSFEDLVEKTRIFGDDSFLAFVYDDKNNLSGGKYYLGHKNVVWYLHGGTSEAARKNKTGYELVWRSILYLKEQNYKLLDLEGVDDSRFSTTNSWGGFSHFKEKFGGIHVQYPYPQVKYYNRILKYAAKITPIEL